MYGHPYFVRIGSGGGENWLREDHPLPAKLALNELKVKGIGVSTYLVQSDVEEAIAEAGTEQIHLSKRRPFQAMVALEPLGQQ